MGVFSDQIIAGLADYDGRDTSVLLGLGIVLSLATYLFNTTNLIGRCQFDLWVSIIVIENSLLSL